MALIPAKYSTESIPFLTELLGGIKSVGKRLMKSDATGLGPRNLLDITKNARVEPITLVDRTLVTDPELTQVLQGLLSFFAATYAQAISLITPVGKIDPGRVLNVLNPDRVGTKGIVGDMIISKLSYESNSEDWTAEPTIPKKEDSEKPPFKGSILNMPDVVLGSNDTKGSFDVHLSEAVNLSVGRMYTFTIGDGQNARQMMISFRLIVARIDPDVMVHILGNQNKSMTIKETWHNWKQKGGGIKNFWKDVVLADDLVKEHRRALLKDNSGTYSDILERRRNNVAASISSGNQSLATGSNLIVISEKTATLLARRDGIKLDHFKTREKIFNSSYAMVIVVMDSVNNRVTYYHSGVKTPTTLSFNELKTANKGSGMDIESILKSFQLGHAVSI